MIEKPPCQVCKGKGLVHIKMKPYGGHHQFDTDSVPTIGIDSCPKCNGKGWISEEDRKKIQSLEMYYQIL